MMFLDDEPPQDPVRERTRREAFEECFRFIEEDANVADRKGDLNGAMVLRRSLRRMREGMKP